jgi:hypothetical protein
VETFLLSNIEISTAIIAVKENIIIPKYLALANDIVILAKERGFSWGQSLDYSMQDSFNKNGVFTHCPKIDLYATCYHCKQTYPADKTRNHFYVSYLKDGSLSSFKYEHLCYICEDKKTISEYVKTGALTTDIITLAYFNSDEPILQKVMAEYREACEYIKKNSNKISALPDIEDDLYKIDKVSAYGRAQIQISSRKDGFYLNICCRDDGTFGHDLNYGNSNGSLKDIKDCLDKICQMTD